jgi:hypothetical protein
MQSFRDIMNEATSSFSLLPSLAEPLKCSSFRHESHGDLGESLCRQHPVLQSVRGAVIMTLDLRALPSRPHFDLVTKEVARNCSYKRIIPLIFESAAFH